VQQPAALPDGAEGALVSLFEKMKTAMADSAERRRQERDFVRAHNLKKDPEQKDRWWFADGRRYIDADLRDQAVSFPCN
jgi:hypothetical protein